MQSYSRRRQTPWPVVAIAAWLIPGAGHATLGHWDRAVVVGAALILLYTAGLLIGGISVVDRQDHRLAFAFQMFMGPVTIAGDYAHTRLRHHRRLQIETYAAEHHLAVDDYDRHDADRHDGPAVLHMLENDVPLAYHDALGRVHELGLLYTTVAGLLNLLVILDAVGCASVEEEEPQIEPAQEAAP